MSCITSKNIIYKQSTETINVSMNFSNWLNTGVALSSPSYSVDIDGITVSSLSVSGQSVTMTISGGANGATYRVQITVNTSDGQTLSADGTLKVRDR